MECPDCRAPLTVDPRFPSWCECGWGLQPPPVRRRGTLVERAYEAAGRRAGERSHRRLAAASALRPRLTPALAAAFTIAALVHLLVLAFLVGGVALAWTGVPNPFLVVVGGLLIAAAVFMRPRFAQMPEGVHAARGEAPALWALVDEVAAAAGTAPPDELLLDAQFNAGWQVAGARRRRVVVIGVPLLAVLGPRERVALVAHELAHARNGDHARGWFVGSAVGALAELCELLRPSSGAPRDEVPLEDGGASSPLLEMIANAMLRVLGLPFWGLLLLETSLLMQDARRAEYLADALAADVAGTDAVVALHEQLLLASLFRQPIRRRAVAGDRSADGLLGELVATLRDVPERERERRRRVARLEGTRWMATHPPTGLRIALLRDRPRTEPRVGLGVPASLLLDEELARHVPAVERALLDHGAAALYA
jgi:Zn-dependent protease with chaperone function